MIRHLGYTTLLLAIVTSSCSVSSSDDPNAPQEISAASQTVLDLSERQLFERGKRMYESSLFSASHDAFEQLAIQYPVGPYLELAMIKMADCSFNVGRYGEAAAQYANYLNEYPGSEAADYAAVQAARSYVLSFRGPTSDPTPVQKARDILQKFLATKIDSPYFLTALQYDRQAGELLYEYEAAIVDFYRRTDHLQAADAREKVFDSRWASMRRIEEQAPSTPPEKPSSWALWSPASEAEMAQLNPDDLYNN